MICIGSVFVGHGPVEPSGAKWLVEADITTPWAEVFWWLRPKMAERSAKWNSRLSTPEVPTCATG